MTISSEKPAQLQVPRQYASAPMYQPYSFEEFDKYVMTTYGRFKIAISHGKGSKLYDTNGKEYIDLVAGIATCTLGHADPRLAQTAASVMSSVHHTSNLFYIPPQGELAKLLVSRSMMDKAFFCNSGAEANEGALKLARKYFNMKPENAGKTPVVITALNSFHGRTLATVTATGQKKYQQGYDPLPSGFDYFEYNDVDDMKATVARINNSGTHKVCAILLEPLQGEGGVRPGTYPFLRAARNLCNETDALLIFDEVQVGVGRTGTLWGHEQTGVIPDVFTLAKGLAGGVPIGALLCKKFCDVFKPGDHASTFGGNFLATSCALTVMNALLNESVLDNVEKRGSQLKNGLKALKTKYPTLISDVRGQGLILGFELAPTANFKSADVVGKCIEKGVLTVPAGPTVVRTLPPLTITAGDIDAALVILDKALSELSAASK